MNKTAIHNIAIAILTLPVFILSVFKPIVKVFSKLSKIFYSQWKRTEFKTCPRNVIIEYKIEVGEGVQHASETLHRIFWYFNRLLIARINKDPSSF